MSVMVPGDQVFLDLMQVLLGPIRPLQLIREISLPIPRLSVGIQGPVSMHFRWQKPDLSLRSRSLPI
jgi:hypothetical protein